MKIEIIKTIGGHRKYNVQKYINNNNIKNKKKENNKEKLIYVM